MNTWMGSLHLHPGVLESHTRALGGGAVRCGFPATTLGAGFLLHAESQHTAQRQPTQALGHKP